jgi:phosphatidylglycerol:prolipoprotein diacylglycerol transferase
VYPLLFHFGHTAIPTYGVFTALALLAALGMSVETAGRAGLRPDKVWNLGLVAILATLIGARLLLVAVYFRTFAAHPFWLLGLASIPNDWVALGGVAIGLLAASLYALAEGLSLLRTSDAVAPAAALAFAINRVGAFLGGAAWGTRTTMPWGVIYRSEIAWIWYKTPLGMKLHPVQLYDAACSLAIFALLLWMGRTPREQAGEIAGAWLFLYGVTRFFLEFYRGDAAALRFLGGALTLAQVLAAIAVVAGGLLLMKKRPVVEMPAAQMS